MTTRRFRRVGVLMGGPSSEREVSLRSGAAVARGLRAAGYEAVEVDVARRELDVPPGIEAVFIALHGEFGEDGTIQELLRQRGMPYTGSGPESSRRSFDKSLSKQVFDHAGIPTPAWEILSREQERSLPFPVVAKPVRQGSSIGVHIVREAAQWPEAFRDALSFDGEVLVERYIEGSELTVGVVGEQVLPVIEIRPSRGFYSYKAKYEPGQTDYLVPAPIPPERARRCAEIAARVFSALGCAGMGRVDFRMDTAGELFVLELNNIPGFTETSLLPKAARAAGLSFPELCDRIMSLASVH
jgi:D-alanine-D-alanine ligase